MKLMFLCASAHNAFWQQMWFLIIYSHVCFSHVMHVFLFSYAISHHSFLFMYHMLDVRNSSPNAIFLMIFILTFSVFTWSEYGFIFKIWLFFGHAYLFFWIWFYSRFVDPHMFLFQMWLYFSDPSPPWIMLFHVWTHIIHMMSHFCHITMLKYISGILQICVHVYTTIGQGSNPTTCLYFILMQAELLSLSLKYVTES